jgi:hypothetical protein
LQRSLLGGWEVSGITRFQSGGWATVTANTSIGSRRADYLGLPIVLPKDQRGPNGWFNIAAFAPAPDTRRGTSSVNNVQLPAMQLWDISARKVFRFGERKRLQFQADMFNAPNHTTLRNLRTSYGNAVVDATTGAIRPSTQDFSTLGTAGPGRNIQLALKFNF